MTHAMVHHDGVFDASRFVYVCMSFPNCMEALKAPQLLFEKLKELVQELVKELVQDSI